MVERGGFGRKEGRQRGVQSPSQRNDNLAGHLHILSSRTCALSPLSQTHPRHSRSRAIYASSELKLKSTQTHPHLPHPPAASAGGRPAWTDISHTLRLLLQPLRFTPHLPHLPHPPAAPAGGRPARTNMTRSQQRTAPSPWRGAPAGVELRVLLRESHIAINICRGDS